MVTFPQMGKLLRVEQHGRREPSFHGLLAAVDSPQVSASKLLGASVVKPPSFHRSSHRTHLPQKPPFRFACAKRAPVERRLFCWRGSLRRLLPIAVVPLVVRLCDMRLVWRNALRAALKGSLCAPLRSLELWEFGEVLYAASPHRLRGGRRAACFRGYAVRLAGE